MGNQYITSFSFSFPAEKPKVTQVKKYRNPTKLKTMTHWYWKASKTEAKIKNNNCET
jgi:hypothetical protein